MAAPVFGMSFRGRLRRELPGWVAQGFVDEASAAKLRQHYRLEVTGAGAALIAAYVLGVLLIGGGVISLVAYNWEELPGAVKLLLTLACWVAAHVAGFRLWKGGSRPALGHALTLLGTLLLGANIGVAAQVFNVTSEGGTGIGLWALGALIAAWLYESGPGAALALLLADIWAVSWLGTHAEFALGLAYVLAALFLPLVWKLRSRLLFAATLVGLAVCHGMVVHDHLDDGDLLRFFLVLAALLLAFALWARSEAGVRLAPVARGLGLAAAAILIYLLSFHDLAEALDETGTASALLVALGPLAIAATVLAGLALAQDRPLREQLVTWVALACTTLLVVVSCMPESEVLGAIAANLAIAALVTAALTSSARSLERLPFWLGSLFAALTILSRFLELDTDLWVKGLGFILCGAGVLWVWVSFERRLKAKGVTHAS